MLVTKIEIERPLEVVANTNPTLAPTSESLVAQLNMRVWWNRQTRYFEVVVKQLVQVQVLLPAP